MDVVVFKALAKEPGRRYESAAEFRADLATAAGGQLPAKRTTRPDEFSATLFGSQAAASQAAVRQLSTDVDDRSLRTQSGPPVLWIWAGIVVIIAIIAAVIYWIFTLQPPRIGDDLVISVPDVVGQTYEDGQGTLEDNGLVATEEQVTSDTVAAGLILRTEPAAGTNVQRGTTVEVTVSAGKPKLDIPDVSRQTIEQATTTLTDAGFKVGSITPSGSPDIPKDSVISTDPGPGDNKAVAGDTINLIVSNGILNVPDITGKPLAEASSIISQLGLSLKTTILPTCKGGTVQQQSIVGEQPQHSSIEITVCAP
jgi:serine/threonine-protein kinase